MRTSIYLAVMGLAFLASCKEEVEVEDNDKTPKYPVSIVINHMVDDDKLVLTTENYESPLGHNYSINHFKYFVSNIIFKNKEGQDVIVPQDSCYFLVNEAVPSSKQLMVNLPEGEYTSMTFTIGVDSLRNTMDISRRQGALDPAGEALGMYWGWNSGYIHLVLEGHSTDIPVEMVGSQNFVFHVGGFGGYSSPTINNIRTVQLPIGEKGQLIVHPADVSSIHISANVNKILRNDVSGSDVNFTTTPSFMFDRGSTVLADNYQYMFTHDSTVNR